MLCDVVLLKMYSNLNSKIAIAKATLVEPWAGIKLSVNFHNRCYPVVLQAAPEQCAAQTLSVYGVEFFDK